jgi:hypothetical protein
MRAQLSYSPTAPLGLLKRGMPAEPRPVKHLIPTPAPAPKSS